MFACYYSGSFSTWSAGLPYFGPSGEIFSHHSGVLSDGATIYDAWRSATKHYWPIQGSLSFQAYSPAGESIPSGNSISPITAGDPIIGSTGVRAAVTLSPERGDQIDFLSSERVVNQSHNTRYPASEEDEANLYGVQLPFHHTLARFSFSAMLRSSIPEGDYIKITQIRVHNAYLSGTFEQNLADSTPGGTLSASSTSWTTTGALSSYANSVAPSPSNLGTRPSGSDYSPIYLIPQEMSEGFQIEVQYERLKAATSPTPALHTVYISKAELEAALGTAQLLRGKSYNFTFLLGEENKIYFEPLVNEWRGQDLSGHIHYEF